MSKLVGIEAGRGIAAMLVVAMHATDHLIQAFGPYPGSRVFAFSHTGVDFFFVLSGFIILFVHARDVGRPQALGHYVQRRFVRIFPFYWLALAAGLAMLLVRHPLPPPAVLAGSAFLLPLPVDLVLGVAWSLQHEVVFYAIFAVLILSRAGGLALLGAWLALIAANLLGAGVDVTGGGRLIDVSGAFDAEFFLGMLAAFVLWRTQVPWPRAVLLLGVAAFLALGAAEDLALVEGQASATHLGYGLASMAIVLGVVEAERQGRLRVPRLLATLGSASYAIYLVHVLAIGVLWQVLLASGLAGELPVWGEFALFVLVAAVAGTLASRLVEKPLMAFVRRLLSGGIRLPDISAFRPRAARPGIDADRGAS